MVLILSEDFLEKSTEEVIDWLDAYKHSYLRINGSDLLHDINMHYTLSNDARKNSLSEIINEVSIVWGRRWFTFNDFLDDDIEEILLNKNNCANFKKHIAGELNRYFSLFMRELSNKNWLPDWNYSNLDKISVLEIASNFGLLIPMTLVCTRKSELIDFCDKNGWDVITKPLSEVSFYKDSTAMYTFKTEIAEKEIVEKMPDLFFPSLFQANIRKKYEIRSFYIDSTFYSMAIFSQQDPSTQTDFRNYNKDFPNRTVAYKLPFDIETKLDAIMKKLNLNTGSIDMIKAINGDYIFLEINPVGQFGMTSFPCNYNLEKVIANYLIKNDNVNE